jgi:tetratricopeptide (TPR) repeat protein
MAEANAGAERHMDAIAEYEAAITGKIQEAEQAYLRELEIDPENVTAQYKLGVISIERGDPARGKELIVGALRVKPDLRHSDYNLGRAEMLLGNDVAAVEDFGRATKTDMDPDVLQQAWYQLGIALKRLHRTQEAQQAFGMFQKLKEVELDSAQQRLKHFQVQKDADAVAPATSADAPPN